MGRQRTGHENRDGNFKNVRPIGQDLSPGALYRRRLLAPLPEGSARLATKNGGATGENVAKGFYQKKDWVPTGMDGVCNPSTWTEKDHRGTLKVDLYSLEDHWIHRWRSQRLMAKARSSSRRSRPSNCRASRNGSGGERERKWPPRIPNTRMSSRESGDPVRRGLSVDHRRLWNAGPPLEPVIRPAKGRTGWRGTTTAGLTWIDALDTARGRTGTTTASVPLLSVRNIEVVYDDVILVLRGLSLEVPQGAIVALLGANGAGKSTTLKAISGLLKTEDGEVTRGEIIFNGERIKRHRSRQDRPPRHLSGDGGPAHHRRHDVAGKFAARRLQPAATTKSAPTSRWSSIISRA